MQLSEGTLLQGGKYRIVRFINSGRFGCTYEAEHVMLGKRVAIKEFFVKDFCNRDEQTSHVTVGTQTKVALVAKLRKKFLEEAVALSKLHHENIVQVTDVFEDNGTAYYVMDYINGRSIHDILKTQRTIPESQAVKYICQVAEALKHVHAQNRLHLDIKPGNIMIDEHDNAILINFGASKQCDEEAGENTSTLLGKTPGYAPIEQMGNSVQNFTPATDIYSLGATLYKMLTGITPPEATILASDDNALQPLSSLITPQTRNAVEQAMRTKKKERPQRIDDFLNIIDPTYKREEKKADKRNIIDKQKAEEDTVLDSKTTSMNEYHFFGWSNEIDKYYYYHNGRVCVLNKSMIQSEGGVDFVKYNNYEMSLSHFTHIADHYILCCSRNVTYIDALRLRKRLFKSDVFVRIIFETDILSLGCNIERLYKDSRMLISLNDGYCFEVETGGGIVENYGECDAQYVSNADIEEYIKITNDNQKEEYIIQGGLRYMLCLNKVRGEYWILLGTFPETLSYEYTVGEKEVLETIIKKDTNVPFKKTDTFDINDDVLYVKIRNNRFPIYLTYLLGNKPKSVSLTFDIDCNLMINIEFTDTETKDRANIKLIDLI